jgi:hypothetical protein
MADHAIIGTQRPEHFVAFRKDSAGRWWCRDSTGGKNGADPQPLRMSPQAYVGRLDQAQ